MKNGGKPLTQKLKAALIGCGRIGYTFDLDPKRTGVWTHAKAYHEHSEIDFIGVYDNNKIIAMQAAATYETLALEHIQHVSSADIISVAVPESSHQDVLNTLLNTKLKPNSIIWMEKPFTGNFQDSLYFVEEFNKKNVRLHINYQRRFGEGFQKLLEFGLPLHVDIMYSRGLYNTASHLIDWVIGLYPTYDIKLYQVSNSNFTLGFKQRYFEQESFKANYSMIEGTQYNICHGTFYFNDKIVKVPPIQTHFEVFEVVKSQQYSEYGDLNTTSDIIKLEYDPMMKQLDTIVQSIKTQDYSNLNNGIKTNQLLNEIQPQKGYRPICSQLITVQKQ